MKKMWNGRGFQVCVILMVTVLLCLGQSFIDGMSAKAHNGAGEPLVLYPDEGVGDSSQQEKEDNEPLSLLPVSKEDEEAKPATADGNISDFLLPETEHGEDEPKNTELDLDSVQPKTYEISGKPNILIYHTHTTEAYRQDGDYTYHETGESRTEEQDKNIVEVGEKLKEYLEGYGFNVIHDTTDHEPPKLATSYSRSLKTMEAYKEKYPDMDMYIDVHRDAANVETNQDDVVVLDGKRCARMMFVVGTGEKYDEKPNFEANYTLAKSITTELERYQENFTRPIRVKTGRYNQHVADMCLLVEVGHNANTLEEAENSVYYLAQAISEVVKVKNE